LPAGAGGCCGTLWQAVSAIVQAMIAARTISRKLLFPGIRLKSGIP
jgi:hypothetical protein